MILYTLYVICILPCRDVIHTQINGVCLSPRVRRCFPHDDHPLPPHGGARELPKVYESPIILLLQ